MGCLTCSALEALQKPILGDQIVAKTEDEDDHATITEETKGILLLGRSDLVKRTGRSDIEGLQVEELKLPGSVKKLQKKLKEYFGQPLTKYNILQIKKTIIEYYRDEGRPVIHVQVPEQNVSTGVLQMIVFESKLGTVRAIGNKHFSDKRILGYVKLKEGEPINANKLIQDLNWMNRNTFRQTDAFFTPGKAEGTTDIDLLTKDRRTWRIYAGTDNTGLIQTGEERWFGGINFGNFLNWDQLFTYQFTSASNYKDFNASSFQWVIPLPWRDILSFYGGYSNVHTNNLRIPFNPGFGTHGQSMQASMRWDVPLPPMVDFLNEFMWGLDWKRTNNNLSFFGTEFFGKSVNLFQIMAGYNLGYEDPKRKVSFTWENFFSPGGWLSQQSKERYNDLRLYARPLYYYTRVTLAPIFRHVATGVSVHLTLRGQWSTANLLSSEEYGIGGYNTVRGYNERQFNGDDAFNGNFEIRTPQWKLFWRKKRRDTVQLLAFYDYGKIWVHKQMPGEPKSEMLDSLGAGIRYIIDPYVTVRADYGYGLRVIPEERRRYKVHFGVVASY
jgi:hemolysin activation/secretion protein